jgi:hypothetical protein
MAAIRGDLSVLSLANLVQALVLDRSSGLLTLEAGADQRVLRISPLGIRLVRGSQRCHRLERLLRRVGRFSSAASDDPAPAGHLLSQEAVARLVREWMFEEICELFTWSRGTFTFEKAARADALESGPFAAYAADCDVTTVALEAARWADELPRIKAAIRDLRQIPVRTERPLPQENFGLDREVVDDLLRLVDGVRPIIHILQLSVFPRFVVLEVLYRLTLAGALRLGPPGSSSPAVSVVSAAA